MRINQVNQMKKTDNESYFAKQLSSGKKINSAKDDPAGLAIANKLQTQSNGLSTGTSNAKDGMSVTNIADSALGSMQDSLQRVRELSLKAGNGIYGNSDKAAMQKEIDGLLKGVSDFAKETEFNTMKLLDGSMANMDIATNPNGGGSSIQMANTTLDSLGLSGYSVMGNVDISAIDSAIQMVSDARSSMGASYNSLQSTAATNTQGVIDQTAGRSRIEDLDIPKAISDKKKEEVLNEYKTTMMKDRMNQETLITKMF